MTLKNVESLIDDARVIIYNCNMFILQTIDHTLGHKCFQACLIFQGGAVTYGLYHKHITIINDESGIISKWCSKLWHLSSLIDDAKVIIYDHNMFIIQVMYHCTILFPNKHTMRLIFGPFLSLSFERDWILKKYYCRSISSCSIKKSHLCKNEKY